MDSARANKRVRQACEPCRKKKSRCPGEKPACSYCQRLGQRCVYNSTPEAEGSRHDRKIEYRIDNLEGKMDRLIQQLSPGSSRPPATPRTPSFDMPWNSERNEQLADLLLTKDNLLSMGRLYLTWCHWQPIALFNSETFLESLTFRDLELILALQSMSLRYPPSTLTPQTRERLSSMAREARRAVMYRIASAEAELSTLQTLCILSMVEFADGHVAQSGLDLSIASHLTQTVHPDNMLGDGSEFADCVRSITMLQNLQGSITSAPGPLGSTMAPLAQGYGWLSSCIDDRVLSSQSQMDSGVMKYVVELSEAWRMARAYAARRIGADALPPWNQQSDYSSVMHLHLEFDCCVPLRYRFAANRFADQDQDSLERHRDYWVPWLFVQIVYAVIPCILNHPFLLSIRLKNFRNTIPQSFIHQSFEYINRHAGWVVYFINLLEKKSFYISDPALAHCVVIVATIHLQHSFVNDRALRDKAQQAFDKCMKFLRGMGGTWPSVTIMANNLAKLRESVVTVPSPNTHGRHSFSINAELLWDMLIYERAGRPDAGVDQSIFGQTLKVGSKKDEDVRTVAEFDLVGSAGISGHKAVSQETPAYAPNEDLSTPLDWDDEERLFEGIGGLNGQEPLYMQANDFGQAIDSWLSLDVQGL